MIYYFDNIYILTGLTFVLLVLLTFLKCVRRKSTIYLLCFAIMYIYICQLIDLTQFPIYTSEGMREALGGQNVWREMNLVPFKTVLEEFSLDILMNIIMTIPLGFGVAFLIRCTWRRILAIGIIIGVCAELGQLLSALWAGFTFRHVNIDDTIMNLLGTVLGYLLFKIFSKIFRWSYQKFKINSNSFLEYVLNVCNDTSDAIK